MIDLLFRRYEVFDFRKTYHNIVQPSNFLRLTQAYE